jgi:hypothetical protein
MLLLTWHGTIVCLSDGGLVHLPLTGALPNTLPFDGALMPSPLAGNRPREAAHPNLGQITVAAVGAGRTVKIKRDELWLCAEDYQPNVRFDRAVAAQWETFLPITESELASLRHILANRWIVRNTRAILRPGTLQLAEGFWLYLGSFDVDIATALPFIKEDSGATPSRLTIRHANGKLELILAEPDASPFLTMTKWPFGGRRTLEQIALAAHRHVTAHEPAQAEFDDDLELLRRHKGAAGLSHLLESLPAAGALSVAAAPLAPEIETDASLQAWAMREVAPWQLNPVPRAEAEANFARLNDTHHLMALYCFAGGKVTLAPKPPAAAHDTGIAHRAELYLAYFQSVAELLPPGFETNICMGLGDVLPVPPTMPLFCFQKERAARSLLMPDIDFLVQHFYDDPSLIDANPYLQKSATAVFAGGTTGGMIDVEAARNLSTPRLRAAGYFNGNKRVDFRLPGITQTVTPEAQATLEAQPFCQKPRLPWPQQFRNRFVISIDGNGATCSRVVIALQSNSVLLKYHSDHVLYYFGALQPWLHYVPVSADSDIEKILDLEARDPAFFEQVAAAGRRFARTYLSRPATQRYTAALLQLYAASFAGP